MATHSSTLAWKIPWMEEPGRLQSTGLLRVGLDWATSLSLFTLCIGEGNGNLLQCSCLENPRDSGAWWAAVYGVAQSQTRLKRLSSSSSSLLDWSRALILSDPLYKALNFPGSQCLHLPHWGRERATGMGVCSSSTVYDSCQAAEQLWWHKNLCENHRLYIMIFPSSFPSLSHLPYRKWEHSSHYHYVKSLF